MPTISGSPTNFNLTSTWTVAYNGSYYYIGTKPNTDTQSVTFNFSSIPAGTKIESAVLYATFSNPVTGAALRTVDGTSFSGSRNVTITPGGSNTFTFRFKANGSASSPTGTKSSTLSVSNVRIVVNEGQTGGGGDPSNPSGTYQSPQYVWFDNTSDAKPGESRTLKWTAGSAHAGRSVKGYDIHRGLTPGGVSYYKSVGNVLQTSVPSHTSNGVSYYYRVLTIQDDNTYYMYSNAVGILKTAWTDTSPPSNLRPSPQFPEPGQTFTLSWDAGESGSNNALKGYKIERAESTDGPWTVIADNLSIRTHNTTSPAEHGGKYYYRGTSIGTYSNGDPSALLEVISVAPSTTGSLSPSTVPMDGESTISLALNNPNSSYGHVVTWSIGSKSIVDELAPGATASTIVVPIDWCEETPNSASGVATSLLETFDGETKVGEASYTFQVTVPPSVVPSISALDRAVVDGYTGLYLRGISSAQLSVTASGTLGSTIPSGGYSLFGAGNSGTTNPWTTPAFNTVGDNNVTAIVIDSRGRSATRTETVHVADYSWPIISAVSARRCLEDGTLNDDGTYFKVKATLAVTSLSGNNPIVSSVVEYKKRGTEIWVLATSLLQSNTETVVGGGNLLASDAYEIRVSLTDTVGKTSTYTTILSPSTRLYDFRTDRAGIGRIAGSSEKQFLIPIDWTHNLATNPHPHGNITSDGKIGNASGLLIGTGDGGVIETKTPEQMSSILEGYWPDDIPPAPHAHGNITNDGKIGSIAGKVLRTGADGLIVATDEEENISVAGFYSPVSFDSLKTEIPGVGYDYTPCIQAAIAAAAVSGGRVILPPARMITTSTIYVPEGVEIEGTSMPGRMSSDSVGSIIDYRGTGTALRIAKDVATATTCVGVSKIRINDALGTGSVGVAVGTDIDGYSTDIKLDRIVVLGFAYGFVFYKCYAIRADLCIARRSGIGWYFPDKGSDDVPYGSLTASCFTSCGGYGYGDETFFTTAGWYILRTFMYSQLVNCYWDGAITGFKISSDGKPIVLNQCGVERFRDHAYWFQMTGDAVLNECKAVKSSGTDFASLINFVRFNGSGRTITMRNMTIGYSGDGSTSSLNVVAGTAHLDNCTYGTATGVVKTYQIS